MTTKNKSAREILEEVERLERKLDSHHPQYDCNLRVKVEEEITNLMKSFIENLHPGTMSFKQER